MKKMTSRFWILPLMLAACNNESKTPAAKIEKDTVSAAQKEMEAGTIAGNFSNQTSLHFDSSAIEEFLKKYPDFSSFKTDLHHFYSDRKFAYAWYDNNGLIEQANNLHNRFLQIKDDGVIEKLPYQTEFNALMDDNDTLLRPEPVNAEAELLLTSQYFSYAKNIWGGLISGDGKKLDWMVPRKKLNLTQLMDSLLYDSNKEFLAQEPIYRQYGLLKSFLSKYRQMPDWPSLSMNKKLYKQGDSSAFITALRKRLYSLGDLSGDTSSMLFDAELTDAVKSFQHRHGWSDDGVVGKNFMTELNKPKEKIIEQILVNMERCRWVPANPTGEYFVVNIPAYKLYIYNNDSLVWDMNIVAGQPVHKTTVFYGDLKTIVFSPYWNVPTSIYQKEILPGIRRDPNYLKKHNMIRDGNSVRQKPGPQNSLGKVKFLFPNSYNIYMHDTPAKSLFKEDKRAFSHGCIRLSEPKKLAMYLLRNYPEWTEDKIDKAMDAGVEKYVTLKQSVPVYIVYFTSWVDRNGKLNLVQDVYNRDSRLAEMMIAKK